MLAMSCQLSDLFQWSLLDLHQWLLLGLSNQLPNLPDHWHCYLYNKFFAIVSQQLLVGQQRCELHCLRPKLSTMLIHNKVQQLQSRLLFAFQLYMCTVPDAMLVLHRCHFMCPLRKYYSVLQCNAWSLYCWNNLKLRSLFHLYEV